MKKTLLLAGLKFRSASGAQVTSAGLARALHHHILRDPMSPRSRSQEKGPWKHSGFTKLMAIPPSIFSELAGNNPYAQILLCRNEPLKTTKKKKNYSKVTKLV